MRQVSFGAEILTDVERGGPPVSINGLPGHGSFGPTSRGFFLSGAAYKRSGSRTPGLFNADGRRTAFAAVGSAAVSIRRQAMNAPPTAGGVSRRSVSCDGQRIADDPRGLANIKIQACLATAASNPERPATALHAILAPGHLGPWIRPHCAFITPTHTEPASGRPPLSDIARASNENQVLQRPHHGQVPALHDGLTVNGVNAASGDLQQIVELPP